MSPKFLRDPQFHLITATEAGTLEGEGEELTGPEREGTSWAVSC